MGVLAKLSVIAVALATLWSLSGKKPASENLGTGSFVAPGWERVEKEFRKQLKSGLLTAGAFSVYHKGKCVVDISGGYANEDSIMLWDNRTMAAYFSTTKGVASVVIAMLVDRGLLDYSKPVRLYWPEFAQNGKKDITVEQLVSHQAGLIAVEDFSFFDVRDENTEEFQKILAEQKPHWTPGTAFGYHALTKGLYEDALVRKVDPKHRSMQKFFQEEVADVFGIDFYIGAPPSEFYRVSQNHQVSLMDKEILTDPSLWALMLMLYMSSNPLFSKAMNSAEFDSPGYWNNPEFLKLNSPASHGVGTAESLAKFYGILANGGVYKKKTLLSKNMIEKLGEEIVTGIDSVLKINWTLGRGTMLMPPPEQISDIGTRLLPTEKTGNVFGTPGAGGQMAIADTKNKLGISYLTNYMSWYGPTDPRYIGLTKAVYESLNEIEKKKKKK